MSVEKRTISTPEALSSPALSQAVQVGNLLFVSGQVGIKPGNTTAPESLEDEIELAIDGLEAVLKAAGAGLSSVVKTSCYLRDINDMSLFNDLYMHRFPTPLPSRTTIQAGLAMGLRFEIDAVAVLAQ
jgi:2-iminobutanoate/2-iminopropanoate deaminase